jgi:hypothetical protein
MMDMYPAIDRERRYMWDVFAKLALNLQTLELLFQFDFRRTIFTPRLSDLSMCTSLKHLTVPVIALTGRYGFFELAANPFIFPPAERAYVLPKTLQKLTVHCSEEESFYLPGLARFFAYTEVANPKLRAITIRQNLARPDWADCKHDADYVELGRQAGTDFRVLRRSTFQLRTTAWGVGSNSNRALEEVRKLHEAELMVYGTRDCYADLQLASSMAAAHTAKKLKAVLSGVGVLKKRAERVEKWTP